MKITHYTIALLLCCCASAFARIGETLEQCKQRYGQPYTTTTDGNYLFFRKAPFIVIVNFYQGKAADITYRKIEQNALGKGVDISDNEIEQLLKLNGGDRQWKPREVVSVVRQWETQDGQLQASKGSFDNYLAIMTKEAFERMVADAKQKENKALEGL